MTLKRVLWLNNNRYGIPASRTLPRISSTALPFNCGGGEPQTAFPSGREFRVARTDWISLALCCLLQVAFTVTAIALKKFIFLALIFPNLADHFWVIKKRTRKHRTYCVAIVLPALENVFGLGLYLYLIYKAIVKSEIQIGLLGKI